MGYDCYVRGAEIREMPDLVDRAALADYFEWQNESGTYLRRSIGGIGDTRIALLELGMAFDPADYGITTPNGWTGEDGDPEVRFPHYADFGIGGDEQPQEDDPRLDQYRAELDRVLRWHGPEVLGIPIHKLCDNSGWIVTKEECQAALLIYRKALENGQGHPEAFEDDLIPFLVVAARHDGFEVH